MLEAFKQEWVAQSTRVLAFLSAHRPRTTPEMHRIWAWGLALILGIFALHLAGSMVHMLWRLGRSLAPYAFCLALGCWWVVRCQGER